MSDVEEIDAVFGEHRSTLARIEQARTNWNAKARRAGLGSTEQSAGARWGLNPDLKQRVVGLVLLIVSALALFFPVTSSSRGDSSSGRAGK